MNHRICLEIVLSCWSDPEMPAADARLRHFFCCSCGCPSHRSPFNLPSRPRLTRSRLLLLLWHHYRLHSQVVSSATTALSRRGRATSIMTIAFLPTSARCCTSAEPPRPHAYSALRSHCGPVPVPSRHYGLEVAARCRVPYTRQVATTPSFSLCGFVYTPVSPGFGAVSRRELTRRPGRVTPNILASSWRP